MDEHTKAWVGGIAMLVIVFAFFGWPMAVGWLEHREECRRQRHKEQLELARAKGERPEA